MGWKRMRRGDGGVEGVEGEEGGDDYLPDTDLTICHTPPGVPTL
jgi:hypothetical protein